MQVNHNNIIKRFFKVHDEINQEVLSAILQDEQTLELVENYYETVQGKKINREMRAKLAQWMILLCDDLKVSFKTKQSAIILVDLVLSKMPVDMKYLQLLGITAIFIFIKYEESIQFTLENAAEFCGGSYTTSNISLMEMTILKHLQWKLHYSTPGEIARRLIYCFNTYYDLDLSKFFKKIDNYIDYCISENDFSDFSPNTLAVAGIILAFEENFDAKNHFVQVLKESASFDYEKVEYLYNMVCEEKNGYDQNSQNTEVSSENTGTQNPNDETFDQGVLMSANSQNNGKDLNGDEIVSDSQNQSEYVTPPTQQNKNSCYLDSLQKTEKIFRDHKETSEMDEERYYQ